ncbi:uncharacterized protein LOC9651691 [Selaginella moellendorffii]|uniref:uncharacterized protein LOC9651691 n=1 Tax=Selaginella moellendorffii TaxID=88036 RepID=UPI000D1C3DB5|nr:uncharacterized protein LOC9651691 [Selaginella moellendorffii]|eukprot:XP_002972613.2 uncharacterized protein LOC9651691 [Selaginella moellendorffii]
MAATLLDHPPTPVVHKSHHPASRSIIQVSAHRSIIRPLQKSRLVAIRRWAVDNDVVASEQDDSEIDLALPLENVDRRREEKFAVRDLGKHQCRSCGYVYDQTVGDPSYPIAPGVEFAQLPEDWRCSTCGAAKSYFNSISVEVAGFAENQSYGFGTNTLTSGQKSLLIYGSLVFFFILFLSGYFLQ